MRHAQKIRTTEKVPIAGLWQNVCSRPGCEYVEDLLLDEGMPAPPCRHCCNGSELHYLGYMRLVSSNEPRIGFVAGRTVPARQPAALVFISPPADAPAAAPPPAAAAPADEEPEQKPGPSLIGQLLGRK